ncbi:hypothetical protein BYT27DRAFT_7194905 [Phlegmacium glaucopus]|nr:hypothetical protein BYT27DRAFT_7194905 [Phlegmacium glaucopus]
MLYPDEEERDARSQRCTKLQEGERFWSAAIMPYSCLLILILMIWRCRQQKAKRDQGRSTWTCS